MGKLVKAVIYELDRKDNSTRLNPIQVCFNPSLYTLEKSVQYNPDEAVTNTPVQECKVVDPLTMSVELKFDTYEERCSVRDKWVKHIEKLTMMKEVKEGEDRDPLDYQPPNILFVWGKLAFMGKITKLTQKYTMFLSDGTPVRADVNLTIVQTSSKKGGIDSSDEGNASNDAVGHSIQQGDRHDSLPVKHGCAPGDWRQFCRDVDNPKDIGRKPGVSFRVGRKGR